MERSEILKSTALAGGTAFITLVKTAIEDHRIQTHDSLELPDAAEKSIRTVGSFLTDTKRWACVHRIHHSTPDANLTPFVELHDHLKWREKNRITDELPDKVYGLDPVLNEIDIDSAREIGKSASEIVKDKYMPESEYTIEDSDRILFNKKPRFFYESKPDRIKDSEHEEFTEQNLPRLHDIRFMLRDPHSPALHKKGVPGILLDNVSLYGYAERKFANSFFRPEDLLPDSLDIKLREHRAKLRYAYVGAMIFANIGMTRPDSVTKIVRSAVVGAATSGLAVTALIAGGNITNAFGHAGDINRSNLSDFLNGIVHPKKDGTYTSNSHLLSAPTLDEVGGQEVHHDLPNKIAYSKKSGPMKFVEAPFGTIVETMAKKNFIFRTGDNFNDADHRPDEPSEAVLMIQEKRAEYLKTA